MCVASRSWSALAIENRRLNPVADSITTLSASDAGPTDFNTSESLTPLQSWTVYQPPVQSSVAVVPCLAIATNSP